ncbi:MAG TPA: preprotein translocase subunit SecE [Candidatus Saccharimonadales bacterium]|nr:preprotein translocase subunit SecE [Candidatus Saccharimonadales bacterium]
MATEKTTKKVRRIRSSSEADRKRSDKADQVAERQLQAKTDDSTPVEKIAPLAILQPLRWIGRHIVPRYFRDSFKELRLITWPSRKQSRQLTTAVVIFATIFAILVSSVDLGLDKIFKKVFLHE